MGLLCITFSGKKTYLIRVLVDRHHQTGVSRRKGNGSATWKVRGGNGRYFLSSDDWRTIFLRSYVRERCWGMKINSHLLWEQRISDDWGEFQALYNHHSSSHATSRRI